MGIGRTVGVALALVVPRVSRMATQRRDPDWASARAAMVRDQLRGRDIVNPRVLDAMSRVPRHLFVPDAVRADAYGDFPLPIGDGQTISQPYIVGFMSQALEVEPHHRVLEIGTGSGYQAAILAELAKEVYTIEIVAALSDRARKTIEELGYKNVHIKTGNGYLGWPEHAPYDRVMVTAAPDAVATTSRRAAAHRRSHGHPRRHDRPGAEDSATNRHGGSRPCERCQSCSCPWWGSRGSRSRRHPAVALAPS